MKQTRYFNQKKISRRNFLKKTLLTSVGLAAAPYFIIKPKQAKASTSSPRFLINIVCFGGWDATWFHSTFPSTDLSDHVSDPSQLAIDTGAGGFPNSQFQRPFKLSTKQPDAGMLVRSPTNFNGQNKFYGIGMKTIFDQSMNDILIWEGIKQEGQHGVGNYALNQGGSSSYAISFSGIVAQGVADRENLVRPLHYVSVSNSPVDDCFTSIAMARGAAVPICIPDVASFETLTNANQLNAVAKTRRNFVQESVQRLSEAVLGKNLTMSSSVTSLRSFNDSMHNAALISGSGYSTSIEFMYTYQKYVMGMIASMIKFSADPAMGSRRDEFTQDYNGAGLQHMQSLFSALPSDATMSSYRNAVKNKLDLTPYNDLSTQLAYNTRYRGGDTGRINEIMAFAFKFALADFLVQQNLAAVIDIPGKLLDSHANHIPGLFWQVATFAGFQLLVSNLKSVGLLNQTLIAMHTELDRLPYYESRPIDNSSSLSIGTNHGNTTSMLFSGGGVNQGAHVGGVNRGPIDAQFPRPNDGSNNYGYPLNINVRSGVPDPDGSVVSTKCVLPTVLKLFQVDVPPRQITEGFAIPAIIKT